MWKLFRKSNEFKMLLDDDSLCSKSYDKKHNYSSLEFKCHYCDRISYIKLLKIIYWVGFTLHIGNRWRKRGDEKALTMNMLELEAKDDLHNYKTEQDIKNKILSEYNRKDFSSALYSSNLNPFITSTMNRLVREIDAVVNNF